MGHLCVRYCVGFRSDKLMEGNHYFLLHQPGFNGFLVLSINQATESKCVYASDLFGRKSYFTSSALVSGKEWLALISKMLLTKTLGLKISKLGIVWHMCVRNTALMSSVHFVPCSRGPSLRIISRNAEMRFGLKHDFMN